MREASEFEADVASSGDSSGDDDDYQDDDVCREEGKGRRGPRSVQMDWRNISGDIKFGEEGLVLDSHSNFSSCRANTCVYRGRYVTDTWSDVLILSFRCSATPLFVGEDRAHLQTVFTLFFLAHTEFFHALIARVSPLQVDV